MTKKIRVQRLRWLGQDDDENVGKRVFERNPEGKRRSGRPMLNIFTNDQFWPLIIDGCIQLVLRHLEIFRLAVRNCA